MIKKTVHLHETQIYRRRTGESSFKTFTPEPLDSILADARSAAATLVLPRFLGLGANLMLIIGLIAGGAPAMALEQPQYEILVSDGDLELRRYASHIVAETYVTADFERAGNEGFRRLADYIFGNNSSRQEMAMTAPVGQSSSERIAMTAPVSMHRQGDSYRITFMMPSRYSLDTLPEPVNPAVMLREVPSELVAAVRYSGRWSQGRYEDHKAALEAWIAERGWQTAGEPVLARYDPPFKPWFLRRNEVLIPLKDETLP